MKIYIPKHLRKLKIVDNLCNMIEEYSKITKISPTEKYYNPVEKFLRICSKKLSLYNGLSEKEIDNIWEGKIKYYTNLLYCHKGCLRVLELLKDFLEKECSGSDLHDIVFNYNYDLTNLVIELNTIPNEDELNFNNHLKTLLENLLYFDNFILSCNNANDINIDITDLFKNTKMCNNISEQYSKVKIKFEKT